MGHEYPIGWIHSCSKCRRAIMLITGLDIGPLPMPRWAPTEFNDERLDCPARCGEYCTPYSD